MIHVVTMAFNRPCFVELAVRDFQQHAGALKGTTHWLLDQHYPLPDKEENTQQLLNISYEYGLHYLDAGKNLGYHEGINYVVRFTNMRDEDIVIVYDPDALMFNCEWVPAIIKCFEADPQLALVSATVPNIHDNEFRNKGMTQKTLNGIQVAYPHAAVCMSVSAWKVDFILKNGGLKEPRPFYGGIEARSWLDLKEQGRTWACLLDYQENVLLGELQDPIYREYKLAHASPDGAWPTGDFDSYLRHKGYQIE